MFRVRLFAAFVFRFVDRSLSASVQSRDYPMQEVSDRSCLRGQGFADEGQALVEEEDQDLEGLSEACNFILLQKMHTFPI